MKLKKIMGFPAVITAVLMVVVVANNGVMGNQVYKVGDSAGWTNIGHVDYKAWSASKNFIVGDTIVFEYNKDFQNVAKVTHKDFQTCNGNAPLAIYSSGNDSFPITIYGHYFFICTLPGHCESGQKVDVRVLPAGDATPPPSSGSSQPPLEPLPFPYPPPAVPYHSPGISPSHSPSPKPAHSATPPTSSQSMPPASPPSSQSTPPASPPSSQSMPPASPPSNQSPPPSHPPSQSQPPSATGDLPTSSPPAPTPYVAPAPQKNGASRIVDTWKLWMAAVWVSFYLVTFMF